MSDETAEGARSARRRELERRAFGVGADDGVRRAAVAALAALGAPTGVDGPTHVVAPSSGDDAASASDHITSADAADAPDASTPTGPAESRPSGGQAAGEYRPWRGALVRHLRVAVACAVGLTVGIGGTALAQRDRFPAVTPMGSGSPSAGADDEYLRLDAPQVDSDVPPVADLDDFVTLADLRLETLRRLPTTSADIPAPLTTAYVGRDRSSRVCIVLVRTDGSFAKSCAPGSDRPTEALSLAWTTTERFADSDDPLTAVIGLRLTPEGDLGWTVARIYTAGDDDTRIVDFDQY